MQLIDITYFVGEINVANTDQLPVRERLELFIKKYEKRFLTQLLGEAVYNEFMTGLQVIPVLQKWEDLKDKLVDDDTKESPVANYVYYFYMRDNYTQTVGVGEVKAKAENSVMSNNDAKMVRAWNEMVLWVDDLRPWFVDNQLYYSLTALSYYFRTWSCWPHYHEDPFRIKNTLNL